MGATAAEPAAAAATVPPHVNTTSPPPDAATTISPRDEFLQADDAEDEEELQSVVDAALHSIGESATTPVDQDLLVGAIQRQVEYLFSNQSLWRDAHLQSEMKKDATGSGFVSLQAVIALKPVRVLTGDLSVLTAALERSEKLALSESRSAVHRLRALPAYDQYKDSNRTIFVDRLPPSSTVASVKKMFTRFGKVQYVLRADHILGASGQVAEEKGKLTPHASPQIKPRRMSNVDVTHLSPMLAARKLTQKESAHATPAASPLIAAANSPICFLSPAQRNRAIAAQSPVSDPAAFAAAFIQFEKPAFCKKAISHIVAYNKQLKAATPKGSPRLPMARRGSHGGGVPTLPAAAMGGSGSESTPPRTRTIRILSQEPSPFSTPLSVPIAGVPFVPMQPHQRMQLSPRVKPISATEVHTTSPPIDLPGGHPASSISPPPAGVPPRHSTSPAPSGPLSPFDRAARERRASVASPPPINIGLGATAHAAATSRKLSAAGLSPTFSPLTSPYVHSSIVDMTHARDGLPELSLGGTDVISPTGTLSLVGGVAVPVAPLPDHFIGLFVMPKTAYLKSLATMASKKKGATETNGSTTGAQAHTSTELHATHSPAIAPKEREKQLSPTPLILQPAAAAATTTAPASNSVLHSVLSASAAVFQPSAVPLVAPAPIKPTTVTSGSSSPPITNTNVAAPSRALKTNWRSDGSTPVLGPVSTAPHDVAEDAFALTFSGSPTLGPTPSPQFDADGQPIPPVAAKKKKSRKSDVDVKPDVTASPLLSPDRPRFSLTNTKRNSLGGLPENARNVISRFALGPISAEAVGFAGRGRTNAAARPNGSPIPPAGGGKAIVQ